MHPELIQQLIKIALPFILSELVKSGCMSEALAVAAKFEIDLAQALASVETFPVYPHDPKAPESVSNINPGESDV